jgi:hypothetical protein
MLGTRRYATKTCFGHNALEKHHEYGHKCGSYRRSKNDTKSKTVDSMLAHSNTGSPLNGKDDSPQLRY